MHTIGHYINGRETSGQSTEFSDVFNPATGEAQARLAIATPADLDAAVASAVAAQPAWAAVNPQRRGRVLLKFVELINRDMDKLARLISSEHGKTVEDAKGDILRGMEVAEFMTSTPHLLKGEFTSDAGPGVDMYSMRQPLGVGAGITPFNFPVMIPLWMMVPAIAAGNAFILKPSERTPTLGVKLAELMTEAGLPAGVLSVVQGGKETVDRILHHPEIAAVSFVGSTPVAKHIYATAAAQGKRVQALGGAKNHMIIMPDADIDKAADALMGGAYGSAGQRCMAVAVAVPVGEKTAEALIDAVKARISTMKIGPYTDDSVEMGPVVTKAAQKNILSLIDKGVQEGAALLVDGRTLSVPGHENGFFVGPTLFDHVTTDMTIYREEIFGPVLSIMRAKNYEEALSLPMKSPYGNGCAIFTRDGDTARDFANRINIGMVGINVPVPAPLAYYSFGGWKGSAFGDLGDQGTDSLRFWTRTKTVTSRWPSGIKEGAEFQMPTMK